MCKHPYILALACLTALPALAASDFQWTFDDQATVNYIIDEVSSDAVYAGPLNAADPTIRLIVGRRYGVTIVNSSEHPFQVIAKGASAVSDIVLLAQGQTLGTLEDDTDIDWFDSGGVFNGLVEFTVTQALVEAMQGDIRDPGYRCGTHTTTMRGDFVIAGLAIDDPIPGGIPASDVEAGVNVIASGIASPLGIVFDTADPSRAFIYTQTGVVHLRSNGTLEPTPFLDVSARLVPLNPNYDERGLLGFALHPDFPATPRVYTYTSEPVAGAADFTTPLSSGAFNHQSVVAEWTVDDEDADVVDPATRRELMRIDQPQGNHNGGTIRFDLNGLLHIALGDGGGADDTAAGHGDDGNGQDLTNVYGTVLRIEVDGGGVPSTNGEYGIPADNPFISGPVREIYAYGFRNPYAFSFDMVEGGLWLGDVGQNDIEEIDLVGAGQNFGWNLKEGSFFFDPNGDEPGFVTDAPVGNVPPDLVDPVAEYDHDEGAAVVGGFVYRGDAIPELAGRYIFGDYSGDAGQGRVFHLIDGNEIREFVFGPQKQGLGLYVKGFGQDPSGEVYICGAEEVGPTGTGGAVLKIVPLATGDPLDLDGDGLINAVDVQLVINGALGLDIGAADADVDNDGDVDAVDVQLVINGALGL